MFVETFSEGEPRRDLPNVRATLGVLYDEPHPATFRGIRASVVDVTSATRLSVEGEFPDLKGALEFCTKQGAGIILTLSSFDNFKQDGGKPKQFGEKTWG